MSGERPAFQSLLLDQPSHIYTINKRTYAGPDKEIGATRMLAADLDRRYALTRG